MAATTPNDHRRLLQSAEGAADGTMVFSRRALVLGMANAAVFGGLAARLYDLQVLNGPQQSALAEDNRTRTLWVPPMRGQILDANGVVLASSRETFRIMLYPQRGLTLADASRLASELAPRLGMELSAVAAGLKAALHDNRPLPVVLADGLSYDDVAALQVGTFEAANVVVEPQHQRVYPELKPSARIAMAHIVGSVGAVDRFSLDDDPHLRLKGARVGKVGVEAGMETALRGVAGRTVYEIDARGRHVRRLDDRESVPGRAVTLTIDIALQEAVMGKLAAENDRGAAVVLDIATGAILALASTPSFDGAAVHAVGAQWRELKSDPARPLVNRATTGQYPPGSTFKLVTALAALEAGLVTPKEKIECWGDVTYSGHTYRCWNRKGHIASDLHKAIRESCDCYFYEAARRAGIDRIAAMASELGLGEVYRDAGIAPQKRGLIPTPAWKRSRTTRTGWLLGETILAGIGQGYVQATPLQLAVMMARVASGRKVVPSIVRHDVGDGHHARSDATRQPEFEPLAISETHLAALRRALKAVVHEGGGTGQAADPDDGRTLVAGKTGTSQVSRASADRDRTKPLTRAQRDHALFVAYAPADAPRFAIATVLEHAGSGGTEAGPLVADIVRLLMARDRPTAARGADAPAPAKEG